MLETIARLDGAPFPSTWKLIKSWAAGRLRYHRDTETIYCAEVVAATYQAMGLLPEHRPQNWYDPGKFWSGDGLALREGRRSARRSPSGRPAQSRASAERTISVTPGTTHRDGIMPFVIDR